MRGTSQLPHGHGRATAVEASNLPGTPSHRARRQGITPDCGFVINTDSRVHALNEYALKQAHVLKMITNMLDNECNQTIL